MRDVALASGVAKSTVSLALRKDSRVNPETSQRILAAANRLGYSANPCVAELMAHLSRSRSRAFQGGLVLANLSPASLFLEHFHTYRSWVDGIKQRSNELGYVVEPTWILDPSISPARLRHIMRGRNIRGIILALELGLSQLPGKWRFLWEEYPAVVLGSVTEPRLHVVLNDQYTTTAAAVKQLVLRGRRRLGLMRYPQQDKTVEHRYSGGFASACREYASSIEEMSILNIDFPNRIEHEFKRWVHAKHLDAVLSFHSMASVWLRREGKRVPEDISVAHLDWGPELGQESGMNQNNSSIGMAAVDLLVSQIHLNERGVPAIPRSVMVESTWMEGNTVGKRKSIGDPCRTVR